MARGRTAHSTTTPVRKADVGRLMEAYLDGDHRAFRRLYTAVAPRVRRQICASLGDDATVDDVLQATFMKGHVSRSRFRWRDTDPDKTVLNWYCAIARNTTIDFLRQRTRSRKRTSPLREASWHSGVSRQDPVEAPGNQEDVLMQREAQRSRVQWVHNAVSILPPPHRQVVELHKLAEVPIVELAQRLEVRTGTLRVRAHRAYRMLADRLRDLAPAAA